MVACCLALVFLASDLVKAPKMPKDLGFPWHLNDILGADELHIHPEYDYEMSRWLKLYGVDVLQPNQKGYSGARQDFEILLGPHTDIYFEDEKKGHPIIRNSYYQQYVWAWGKLLQFELVRDGWAKVNDEGRKGRYGQILLAAQAEAQRFHEGVWADRP